MDPHPRAYPPSKRLGQNFLIEPAIAEQLVSSIVPSSSDTVLEPGPGHGTLTRLLVRYAGRVIAIEKDPRLVDELREKFRGQPNLTILKGDILRMGQDFPWFNKLVSTPPYYISSKLVLLLAGKKFDVAAVVFQKEFGERLLAEPGTSDYGRLSIMARRKLDVAKVRDISRDAFRPRPKVDSVLLQISPKHQVAEIDELVFEELVRGIFTQRRRLIKSALAHYLRLKYGHAKGNTLLRRLSLPEARVYQLTIDELENLSLEIWRAASDELASTNLKPST
ncbi:ribosomal RNA small subunit methyltransferase A [Candidatus Bathyarchaeota archaeon]|nr:ribosomal RNA small subunit methyltransferase A [Candidatus Bathyarchaeota archaeon]